MGNNRVAGDILTTQAFWLFLLLAQLMACNITKAKPWTKMLACSHYWPDVGKIGFGQGSGIEASTLNVSGS